MDKRIILWSVLVVCLNPTGPSRSAEFIPLGDLPGGAFDSRALAISPNGSIVVGRSDTANGTEAFYWTRTGGMTSIGDLPGGDIFANAFDVSADGSVIVGFSQSHQGLEAFRWEAGQMEGLGDLSSIGRTPQSPGGGFQVGANAISADGSVIVGNTGIVNGTAESFRRVNLVPESLGDLAGGDFSSGANGVSEDGEVVVGRSSSAAGPLSEAYRWENGVMEGLGDLTGGAFESWAIDVSPDGRVVIGWGTTESGIEAFRWTRDENMISLNNLPGGSHDSRARALNADGSIVVGDANRTSQTSDAFIWDPDHGMRNLQNVLATDYGLDQELSGWILTVARAISDDGSVIAGKGMNSHGDVEAWVVIVPELAGRMADFDADADVDGDDFLLWQNGFPTPNGAMKVDGDADGDGDTDGDDFLVWQQQFGQGRDTSSAAAVPEPRAVTLLLAGALAAAWSGRRAISHSTPKPTPLRAINMRKLKTAVAAAVERLVAVPIMGVLTIVITLTSYQALRRLGSGRTHCAWISLATAMLGVVPFASASEFIPLGDLPGGEFHSRPWGVSPDGSTVVGRATSSLGTEAFYWTQSDGMVGLGDLPGGGFYSAATDVTPGGSVIVGISEGPSGMEAVRREAGEMTAFSDLSAIGRTSSSAGGGFLCCFNAVSADGSVMVGNTGITNGTAESFRLVDGWPESLGKLPGGTSNTGVNGVSADGSVAVGRAISQSGNEEAYRWEADVMTGLGELPGGLSFSKAIQVSADGHVVVGQSATAAGMDAFRWTASEGMVSLGELPGSPHFSVARDLTVDGSIVVGIANLTPGDPRGSDAFIWDATYGMRNLQQVLTETYGLGNELVGWTLHWAMGVSDDGTVITGIGTNPGGDLEGWVAITPERLLADADFDSDGDVDANDFLWWQIGFGDFSNGGAYHEDGDADRDGDVDGDDFLVWQQQYATGGGAGGRSPSHPATIPEPAAVWLLCLAAVWLLLFKRAGNVAPG